MKANNYDWQDVISKREPFDSKTLKSWKKVFELKILMNSHYYSAAGQSRVIMVKTSLVLKTFDREREEERERGRGREEERGREREREGARERGSEREKERERKKVRKRKSEKNEPNEINAFFSTKICKRQFV